MANPEHLEVLKQGVEAWNHWMETDEGDDDPDLSGAVFTDVDLSGADFNCARIKDAAFTGSRLDGVNFSHANLDGVNFHGASLAGCYFGEAMLGSVNFSQAELSGADFSYARLAWCTFAENDLSGVLGLEAVMHTGPCSVGVDTIYLSQGRIPEVFLRGCGLPESFIARIQALVAAMQPIQFYSCFISYSSRDQEFAERLHADLQAKGVRVWFAPHDMKIGAKIRPAIDESIRLHDKLLLVLSEASVSSQWVEQEVETALAREREPGGGTVLFPVRIDDAVMESKAGWPVLLKNTRNVGDFTRWKKHDSYQRAFERLLRDLKAGA